MHSRRRSAPAVAVFVALVSWCVLATPDLELNPHTGFVESVDLAEDGSYRVRHVIDEGQGGSRTVTLISTGAGESPRLAIKSAGDSWVVWWRDEAVDTVYCRVRDTASGAWGPIMVLSESDEDSQDPEIVHDPGSAWVAFEIVDGAATTIGVLSIIDDAEPMPLRTILTTTSFSGNVDVLIHAEASHVWATWVHSSSDVGWSEYDSGTSSWDAVSYQSYASSSIPVARKAIRNTVLGL